MSLSLSFPLCMNLFAIVRLWDRLSWTTWILFVRAYKHVCFSRADRQAKTLTAWNTPFDAYMHMCMIHKLGQNVGSVLDSCQKTVSNNIFEVAVSAPPKEDAQL